MKPKISIIVPIYNVEEYLTECIESILNQTFKEFELILVNDGSTDNSGDICEKYKNIDDRIKVIHKNNGGVSSARNAGLSIAEGKFIGFVDSDDLIHVEMYEALYKLAVDNEADIVSASVKCFNDIKELDKIESSNYKINIYENNIIEANYNDELNEVAVWNKIYKSKIFSNIRFPEGRIYEDVSTTYKLYLNCNKLVDIKRELYFYRVRAGSITRNKFNDKRFDIVPMYEEQYSILHDKYNYIGERIKYDYYVNLKCIFIDIINEDIENKKYYLEKTSKLMRKEIKYITKNKIVSNKDKLISIIIAYTPVLANFVFCINREIRLKKGENNA